MTTETTEARIAARRAELTAQRAERKDDLDLPRSMTQREVDAYLSETRRLDHDLASLNDAVEKLAALPTSDADTDWLKQLRKWRSALSGELLTVRSPEHERERADSLIFSILLIDYGLGASRIGPIVSLASTRIGDLMQAAGYVIEGAEALRSERGFRGSIAETETRIKALTAQRAAAQAAVDAALMPDAERAALEAETKALSDAFNRMHVRQTGDGRLVAYTEDGAVLEVSAMTEPQRQAFERFGG